MRQRAPVELRLVVADGDDERDVRVEATPDAPARELFAALGLGGRTVLRRGEEIPADAPLSELALRHGDVLHVDSEDASAAAALELVVAGGPDAGRRIPLPPGVHRVGREAGVAIDDPSLSAQHLVLTVGADGGVRVADAGSRNGTAIEGVPLAAGVEREHAHGEVVQAGRTLLAVEPGEGRRPQAAADGRGWIAFNRQPRVQRPLEQVTRPFPAPPNDPQRSRLPLGASLVPLVLGIGLYALTKMPTMLFFSLLSPVMAVTTYMEDRRSGRKGFERHRREYRRRVAALRDELDAERREEAARRRAQAPSAAEIVRRARRVEPTLWERRPDDKDFLSLRAGSAERPSLLAVRLDQGGSDELRGEVEKVAA